MIGAMNSPKVIGYITSAQPKAKVYEMGLLTTWISVLLIPDFPGAAAMRYILVLYFLSFLILDPNYYHRRKSLHAKAGASMPLDCWHHRHALRIFIFINGAFGRAI